MGSNRPVPRSTDLRCRRQGVRGLTLVETLVILTILAVVVWFLIPGADPARRHGQRLACAGKLGELLKGAFAYQSASDGYLPLAWHIAGASVADDLGNLTYSRFAIHEACDRAFRHVVTPEEVEQSVGNSYARRQKFRLTAAFWKCPTKGWTDDYFAPEIAFRRSDRPARQTELVQAVPADQRPLFADVNASLPSPEADHPQDPGHDHEMRNGFSVATESGMAVFIGVGPSLRVDGHLSSGRLDFRHGGAANVIFLDGHADFLRPDDSPRLESLHHAWNHLGGKPEGK